MYLDREELAERMKIKPITAAELALAVGISRQAMYNILNGKSSPRPATLNRIAEALRCTPQALMVNTHVPDEHERFADVVVERFDREGDKYDVKAAISEHFISWLYSKHAELTKEQFDEALETVEYETGRFAENVLCALKSLSVLYVSTDAQARAMEEAFIMFSEVLEIMADPDDFDDLDQDDES